jgi:hypothetical protein
MDASCSYVDITNEVESEENPLDISNVSEDSIVSFILLISLFNIYKYYRLLILRKSSSSILRVGATV